MPVSPRHALAFACACLLPLGASASATTELTLYRSDSPALYSASGDGSVAEGHAVVREQRTLSLQAGTQTLTLAELPLWVDPEALALSFPGGEASVLSQQWLLAPGNTGMLAGLAGREVSVLGSGSETLAQGTLLRASDGLLVKGATGTTLIRNYAAVRSSDGDFPSGASLRLRVDAAGAGTASATLSYPTAGLGWRAAYVATLQPGEACRMRFEARASIANRSGRDWRQVTLQLVAGEPRFAKPAAAPPMMMAMARAKTESAPMPEPSALGDYRLYRLPGAVDLPDGSVSQLPLYTPRTLACQRIALYETGNRWTPPEPMLAPDEGNDGAADIQGLLRFTAFDSLPAGFLRVLGNDRYGTPQWLGEDRLEDTPKGSTATVTLGTAFDLRAERQRTSFRLDKAAHTMDEAFRVVLSNAGDTARVVTVREHPDRWREWTLRSSSVRPSRTSADTLEFELRVPAAGKATLDYAVHYRWTPQE